MLATNAISTMMELMIAKQCDIGCQVRIHIGNLLYDIDRIDTVIDMDTNKPNIVIHVKDK